MKQVVRVLTTYSADLFGVNSALYELGGLIVMHDASGCNSTYNTHNEPRFYSMNAMVYISALTEKDAIIGNDQKLIDDVCGVANERHPRFIALSQSSVPMFIGVDLVGIARVIERQTGIPTFAFATNGMDSYIIGAGKALAAIGRRFCKTLPRTSHKSINLLGVTPLDFSITGNVEALKHSVTSHGYDLISTYAMGDTLDDLMMAASATINLVVSAIGLPIARYLQDTYGIPYVIGLPTGQQTTKDLYQLLALAIETSTNQALAMAPPLTSTSSEEIWIVGEAVWASSIRYTMEWDLGLSNIHIIVPLEETCNLLRPYDLHSRQEEDIERCLQRATIVIGDPIYRRVTSGKFINFPHEAYSGRMYRSLIPLFITPHFHQWLNHQLTTPDTFDGHNDINRHNIPYKEVPWKLE